MPLSAYVDGEYVYGPAIPAERWNAWSGAGRRGGNAQPDVALPCGRPGFLRRSPHPFRTQHFVHRRKHPECLWAHETAAHVEAKRVIVEAARAAGWDAKTEQCGEGWRADVLATAPADPFAVLLGDSHAAGRRIAFEVQLSRQTLEVTVERQRRYRRNGIEGVWLFGQLPLGAEPWVDLPMVKLTVPPHAQPEVRLCPPQVWLMGAGLPAARLSTFVRSWLTKRPAVRKTIRVLGDWPQSVSVVEVQCAACNKSTAVYVVDYPIVTACGLTYATLEAIRPTQWNQALHYGAFDMRGAILEARVLEALRAHNAQLIEGEPITIAPYVAHDGNRGFACHRCFTAVPNDQVFSPDDPARVLMRFEVLVPAHLHDRRTYELPHWCLADQESQCPDTHEIRDMIRSDDRSTWPSGDVQREVDAACRASGWYLVSDLPRMPRAYGGVWTRGETRVAVAVGGTMTAPAIRQLLAVFEDAKLDVLWFVDPATLERFPRLRNVSLIPVVLDHGPPEYAAAGYPARLRVDAGDGHVLSLRDAVCVLLQARIDRRVGHLREPRA